MMESNSHSSVSLESVVSGYYGSKVIDGISFSIDEPGIYVVLGPNGAGKTTLFRTIAGILKPYSGKVEINGMPSESQGAREQLDYLTHIDGIPDGMRVDEALRFYCDMENGSPENVEKAIKLLELGELRNQNFAQLSRGQKKRVSVARIFLREKSVYLLDEPTSNLDPKVARETRELVLGLSRNKIVLYSSHNLYEAREIGNEVLVIVKGKLAMFGKIDDIRTQKYVVGIRANAGEMALDQYKKEGDYYLLELQGPGEVPKVVAELVAKGVQIREVKEMRNPLEELFT
ncbi:MAG: heme ABC exporter ATP-binding protein CcmA [Nitrososphaerota archaeon]|jgi:ABC-2 type transport system ATP-binding protein|nr:heme ABC exporter ATP-binding protein CcmA [Nitrososphaerota archaeon]MDG6923210.1 heme ABC exporter ATP-binding protein CcmA [Nitrososphaerota archaeon]